MYWFIFVIVIIYAILTLQIIYIVFHAWNVHVFHFLNCISLINSWHNGISLLMSWVQDRSSHLHFYSSKIKDWGILFLVCPAVLLSIYLSVTLNLALTLNHKRWRIQICTIECLYRWRPSRISAKISFKDAASVTKFIYFSNNLRKVQTCMFLQMYLCMGLDFDNCISPLCNGLYPVVSQSDKRPHHWNLPLIRVISVWHILFPSWKYTNFTNINLILKKRPNLSREHF